MIRVSKRNTRYYVCFRVRVLEPLRNFGGIQDQANLSYFCIVCSAKVSQNYGGEIDWDVIIRAFVPATCILQQRENYPFRISFYDFLRMFISFDLHLHIYATSVTT